MKSFTTIYTDIQNQIFDTSAATLTIIKQWINNSIHRRTNDFRSLVYLEKNTTFVTQQGTQFNNLPSDYGKLIRISIQVGTTLYSPAEAPNKLFWDRLNYVGQTNYQSQVQYFFYIQGSPGNQQIGFYPTPSTQGYVVNIYYQAKPRGLTQDDYTTGSVYLTTTTGAGVIVTSGVTTTSAGLTQITGTTTGSGVVAWKANMVGQWISLTNSSTSPGVSGDGNWYQISAVTPPNVLTINNLYSGTQIINSATPYTIGEMSVIPEGYEDIIEEDVLARHFRRIQDFDASNEHQQMADMRYEQLVADKSVKVVGPYTAPQVDLTIPNINSFPSNLTGF